MPNVSSISDTNKENLPFGIQIKVIRAKNYTTYADPVAMITSTPQHKSRRLPARCSRATPRKRPLKVLLLLTILVLVSATLLRYILATDMRTPRPLRVPGSKAEILKGKPFFKFQQHAINNEIHEIPPRVNDTGHAPILLVVAYLRSGSSFTASLFTQQQDHFYVFEPLHRLLQQVTHATPVHYINGRTRRLKLGSRLDDDTAFEAMDNWLSCRFQDIDEYSLLDSFHYSHTRSMKGFAICAKHKLSRIKNNAFAIKDCLRFIDKRCISAKLRVFKSIRLNMSVAKNLLIQYPEMKVVHLVRDPRGMFTSQHNLKFISTSGDRVAQLCEIISNDIDVTNELIRTFSNRVRLLRYEDLAEHPFEMLEELYKFVGLKVTREVTSYVNRSTSQNLPDSCVYCTRRGNSSETAYKWRTNILLPFVQLVDRHCTTVYEKLGYIRLDDIADIRNKSIPSIL